MQLETLEYEVRDGVGFVTLARPDAANALNLRMCQELLEVAIACREDRAVRAVLIGSRGKLFCAGGDLTAFASAGDGAPELLKRMTVHLHAALAILARMDAPVVAAVAGAAAGAGMSLACAADLAVAGESAKFSMAYTRAGLVPDGSSSYFLPRTIGRRRTLELMLTNRVLTAAEALEWGLVNQVVPDAELASRAEALARGLAQGPTLALGAVKRLLLAGDGNGLESQMELEGSAISDSARSADGREGIAAFLGKRAPRFVGS